jgi:hypothetical protein
MLEDEKEFISSYLRAGEQMALNERGEQKLYMIAK